MRIVVLRTDRLGELLLTLPLAHALHEREPSAQVTWVVQEPYADVVRLHPAASDVITVPWRDRRVRWRDVQPLIRTLRRRRFALAIVANPHKWLHWAVWRAGIPRRIGYGRKWAWCLTDRVPDVKAQGLRHDTEWNLELLKPLGMTVARPQLTLLVSDTLKARARERLTAAGVSWTGPVIALHPWASTAEKRWPAASFQALARHVRADVGATVLIIGGKEHAAEAASWRSVLPTAVDLVGQLTLIELAAVLSQCATLVSNDSGPAHLAAAVGTPTVTLFGSPHPWQGPIRWRPLGDGHVVLHRVPIAAIRVEDVCAVVRERVPACAH